MSEKTENFLGKRRLHILLIVFLGLLVYSNTFDAPFQFDDMLFVDYRSMETDIAKAVSGLQYSKENSNVISLPTKAYKGPWASRPLLYITFILNESLGGFNTWGYHAVNIAFHITNGILLYLLVVMTGRHAGYEEETYIPVAIASSLIFVLHPIQTEAVTNIINRSMLMATTFFLAGLMLFLKIATTEGRSKTYYTIGLMIAALLGTASRENFATFIIMLALYDLFFISRFKLRPVARNLRAYTAVIPGVVLLGLLAVLNTYDRPTEFANFELPLNLRIPPVQYALTQFKIHWTYIRLLLLPINQSLIYEYPVSKTLLNVTTLFSFFGYAGLWILGIRFAKRRPAASFGILWFLITLLPVSFIIAIMGLRLGDPLLEHRLYLPSIGLIVLAALGLVRLSRSRRSLVPTILIICFLFGSAAYARNYAWTDEGRLWKDSVAKYPNSPRSLNNLAVYYSDHKYYAEAIKYLEESLRYWPGNPQFQTNLGGIYLMKGDIDNCIEHLKTALEIRPNDPLAHQLLGKAYMAKKQYEDALEQFNAVSKLKPWDPEPFNEAAVACYALGRKEDAIEYYIISLWLDRKQVMVLQNISVLYMETGQTRRAIEHLTPLVEMVPEYVTARVMLGKLYLQLNNPFDAVTHLKKAVELSPKNPQIRRVLAEAYEALGNVQSAEEQSRIADELERSEK